MSQIKLLYIICVHFNLYLKDHLYPQFYVVLIKMAYVNVYWNELAEAGDNMSKIGLKNSVNFCSFNPLLLPVCETLKFNYELEQQFIEMKPFLDRFV